MVKQQLFKDYLEKKSLEHENVYNEDEERRDDNSIWYN